MDVDNPNEFVASPSLKVDHVHLKVSNIEESIGFYESILGLNVLEAQSSGNTAYLGPESTGEKLSALLILDQIDQDRGITDLSRERMEAGLYHFAILLPERKYLASFLQHFQKNTDPQFYDGMADHAVSESIYLHDPDYHGIEVYRDRKPSEWQWTGENKIYMVTEPLDVNNLLKQYGNEKWDGFPVRTTIGHVHLHVSNLTKTKKFYQQSLGLYHTASYPGAYFFAADKYHHHVATNTWLGTNILRNSANDHRKSGLEHFAISIDGDKGDLKKLKDHYELNGITIDEDTDDSDKQHESSFYTYDPDGIKIQILLKE
ncbi:Catechol-2,3-dioxygenase [Candidatus Nitrosocosmicus oleophilus]|uniref:Catechol-2,3-dioxygenase n=1 Tax=Candidatus Nitrosocosmicus oleophilus TaxID=1353260 RepID=A0A654LW33_9ARCH|nr:VOC family protein [Candidatus Nitrosocosmicus oleophilus]ALI35415.1 Catechol-2,3-dioxygenase [Candidatus Nitrosocosmicus oleophilus]